MPHVVTFEDDWTGLLTQEQARALIDILYRGEDGHFIMQGCVPPTTPVKQRESIGGLCSKMIDGKYRIFVVDKNIRRRAAKTGVIGGNRRISDPKLAAGLVLAHEVQHANQSLLHRGSSSFYGKPFQRYAAHACEREARGFADDNYGLVAGTLGISIPATDPTDADLDDLVDCFAELDEMHLRDLVDELRNWGLNNPEYVRRCREKLNDIGVNITSGSME